MFKYIKTKSRAFVLILILTLCVTPFLGASMAYAMDEKELVLYAPKDVSVDLYGGLPAKGTDDLPAVRTENLVQKSKTETDGDITYHSYDAPSAA